MYLCICSESVVSIGLLHRQGRQAPDEMMAEGPEVNYECGLPTRRLEDYSGGRCTKKMGYFPCASSHLTDRGETSICGIYVDPYVGETKAGQPIPSRSSTAFGHAGR